MFSADSHARISSLGTLPSFYSRTYYDGNLGHVEPFFFGDKVAEGKICTDI